MRVALACPYDWDAPGGVQVHVAQLSRHLGARGHDVLILAPGDRLGTRAGEPELRIVARPLRVPYQGTVAPIAPSPLSLARVRAALVAFRPDVVHVHEPLVPSTSMAAVFSSPAPVVATFHAYAERSTLFDRAAPLVRPLWRRLDLRLAVSEAAASFVGDRMGERPEVVPNGVDIGPFAAGRPVPGLPGRRRILWVGRLDRQKGFPVAVRAFAEIAGEVPDVTLIVAGDGKDRSAVEQVPAALRDRVVMLGAVPHDRLPGYHAAADLFLAPALGQESFGIVLVEAMAAGLPVVASDIAGYREVVRDGVEGLLVPPGDAGALARAARRILDEPDLAARMSEAGRLRAAGYDWERVAGLVEGAYAEAVRRRRGR